jgi:diaminopimelate decarboxylase
MNSTTQHASTIMMNQVDLRSLVKEHGTPLYVMNEDYIRHQARLFKASFKHSKIQTTIFYASKAFLTLAMAKLIHDEGLYIDVVSLGELMTCIKVGFPPEKILFHGNNKTSLELDIALKHHVGYIVIDNPFECENLMRKVTQPQKVMVRINPGVEAHTHEYISTTKHDSKFGMSIYGEDTVELIKSIEAHPNLEFCGIHCHIGSQIFDPISFQKEARLLLEMIQQLKVSHKINVAHLNLGGGFGVRYTHEDDPFDIQVHFKHILDYIQETCDEFGLDYPHVSIEPGRSLVAQAGVTIYSIGATKTTYSNKKFVFVDGSMADHMRTALYQAKYEAKILERPLAKIEHIYAVAGKACETGDILIHECPLPQPHVGEHLVVFTTGAYHYSMASNYNRLLKPAVIFVSENDSRVVVKAQTIEDLLAQDVLV